MNNRYNGDAWLFYRRVHPEFNGDRRPGVNGAENAFSGKRLACRHSFVKGASGTKSGFCHRWLMKRRTFAVDFTARLQENRFVNKVCATRPVRWGPSRPPD